MESTATGLRRDVSALARRYASDARRVERVLGAARVGLSSVCLFAAMVGGDLPVEHAVVVRWVLATYTVESLVVYFLINALTGSGSVAPVILHAADFAFATTATYFTGGPASPFFVMFVFFVLASAYRWRLRETVYCAVAALVSVAGQWWLIGGPGLDLDRFVLHIAIAAMLLGFLAEDEKQQRFELAVSGDL